MIDVKGDPTHERQSLSIVFNRAHAPTTTVVMRPGPLRLTLDNRTDTRVVPGVFVAGKAMHDLLGHRQPFLTAKRLLSNQTFREIYRTSTLDIDQRLKITSLTFLFSTSASAIWSRSTSSRSISGSCRRSSPPNRAPW